MICHISVDRFQYRNIGNDKCEHCDELAKRGDLGTNLVLGALIVIIIGLQVYFNRQQLGKFVDRQQTKYQNLSNHVTMVIIQWQIISGLSEATQVGLVYSALLIC